MTRFRCHQVILSSNLEAWYAVVNLVFVILHSLKKILHSENLLAVGYHTHRTTESLSLINWQWKILEPYPNVNDIHSTNIITYGRSFFVFGGVVNSNQVVNDIMSLTIRHDKNESWSWVGSLLSKRKQFSAVLSDDKVHIIGGRENHKNEICSLSNIVNCVQDFSIDYQDVEQSVIFGFTYNESCNKIIADYVPKEPKELTVLSKKVFDNIDNFVLVQKQRKNKKAVNNF